MAKLNVRRTGDGTPVVLLHPVGLDGSFWGTLPDELAASSMAVYAVDLLGHGESPDAPRPGSLDAHVESVASLIERIGQPAVVVGVSFGGMVAQNLAITRPDLVLGLMLASCNPGLSEAGRSVMTGRARSVDEGELASVAEAMLENIFSEETLQSELGAAVRKRLLANNASNFASTWEALSQHAAISRLHTVACPTVVVVGDADKTTPVSVARDLARAIPNSRYVEMTGAGHMVQFDRAAEFRTLVLELADVASRLRGPKPASAAVD